MGVTIMDCGIDDISAKSPYNIVRLRLAVFETEQGIAWDTDLDGLDADPGHSSLMG